MKQTSIFLIWVGEKYLFSNFFKLSGKIVVEKKISKVNFVEFLSTKHKIES